MEGALGAATEILYNPLVMGHEPKTHLSHPFSLPMVCVCKQCEKDTLSNLG